MSNKGQFKYKDIGGQAVMEGVMMQSPSDEAMAIAVRRPNGRIMVTCEHREPLSKRHPWMGLPLVRGCVNMVVMLKMGMETNADLSRLTTVSMTVAEIANTRQDPSMPYVGRRAFTHKGGMHIDALLKDTRAYEHISPEIVGNRRVMVVSELSGKAGVSMKMDELGIPHTDEDVRKVLATIKEMESRGYQFEAADASLELLMRRVCQNLKPPFEIPAFRVYMDETSDGIKSEASIKVRDRNGSTEHTAADGDGPVDALSNALKKALSKFFPVMERMRLIDYKVRVLDEKAATAAPVRVIIRSTDGESQWSTVGVSTNVIEASLTALTDSVEYGIYINRE